MRNTSAFQPSSTTKGYWTLNGNSTDYSGNGNSGIDTSITYPMGRFGRGALFIRSNTSRIDVGTTTSLQPTTGLTFSMWIKINNAPASYCGIGGNTISGSQRGYIYDMDTTNISFQVSDGTWGSIATPYTINKWILLTGTWDGSTVRLYKNGFQVGTPFSKASINYTGGAGFSLGNYYTNTTSANMFDGLIDEVIIESRAWSPKEVETYYRKSVLNYKQGGWAKELLSFIISETVSLTETITNLRARNFSVSETATLTETVSAARGKLFTILETVSLSETLTPLRGLVASVSDTIGLTEVLVQIRKLWNNEQKNTSTMANQSKNTVSMSNQSKNDETWVNQNKS